MLIKISVRGQEDLIINSTHVTAVFPSIGSSNGEYIVEFRNGHQHEISAEQFQKLCDRIENWGEQ